ncbi:hypothetical protein VP01_1694g9 [Puccinia sorghi]|uniref:Uncharacterized protein n=1 Tax=Puccinia sorghi TaxID=27349 RepID=A0A0L6VFV6_9BASI|nr:hypothetical protein VP01_1694g9 [Puccinia sorghi]
MNAAAPAGMSDLEKEAKEATEEKKPGMNTIASAIKELYFHDKYASQKHDTAMLVKMVGQVAATNAKACDPEVVSKGILAIFEPYNQAKSAAGTGAAPMKDSNDDAAPSLNTLAHAIHETWEKQITSGNPKLDNAQLLPLICQAIATSSTSGDPTVVAKAIESAYAKVAAN